MYAVIKTGGKQYTVEVGQSVRIEKLNAEVGANVEFDEVLLVSNDGDLKVGTPVVEGAKVKATVEAQDKAKKIVVFKYKAKKNYRKKKGHRQPYTQVKIDAIEA